MERIIGVKLSTFFRKLLQLFIISISFLLNGCAISEGIVDLVHPDIPIDKLDAICEARGGFKSPGPLYVDGYYLPTASPMFGYGNIVSALGNRRFQFIEMNTDWVYNNHSWYPFNLNRVKGSGKYFRFYVAERGDQNCEAYEHTLLYNRGLAQTKFNQRFTGIYPNHCIAAIKSNELKSRYRISSFFKSDSEIPEVMWDVDTVKNVPDGAIYARYSQFKHCFNGRRKNGSCIGNSDDIYMCRPPVGNYSNPTGSIYAGTIRASKNNLLDERPEIVEIQEPFTGQIHYVVPELIKVIMDGRVTSEGTETLKPLYDEQLSDMSLGSSVDAEGYASFGRRTDRYEQDGVKYGSTQPQIWIQNENEHKLLKIDIGVSIARKQQFHGRFICIRAIQGDGVYFIARGRWDEANNFKILKYSWQGKLERVTAGTLPFPFQVNKTEENGDIQHWYGKLKVETDNYAFSILETSEVCGDRCLQPHTEYMFTVPFK